MVVFEDIVKDFSPKIYYFLRRIGLAHDDADEIVQDVFILLWRDLKSGHGLESSVLRLYQHAVKKVWHPVKHRKADQAEDNGIADKVLFILKHYEGFDFTDIADILGVPIPEVRHRYQTIIDKQNL